MKHPLSLGFCVLVPLGIAVFSLLLSGLMAGKMIPDSKSDDFQGVLPSKMPLTIEKPGRYGIWFYERAKFKDEVIESKIPEGMRFHVKDQESGDLLPVTGLDLLESKEVGKNKATFVGSFDIGQESQEVTIVSYGLKEQTVIGVSSKDFGDRLRAYVWIAGVALIGLFIAINVLLVLLNQRKKHLSNQANSRE